MLTGQIGTIVILVLVLVVGGAGFVAYRVIRNRIRNFTRMAFGSDTITGSFQNMEKMLEVTPKSVSAATSLYLPQILRDFPEFHYDEMKKRAENVLSGYLQGIDAKNVARLKEGTTSELREKLSMKIDALKEENAGEPVSYTHLTLPTT